jgi:magnesium transporter
VPPQGAGIIGSMAGGSRRSAGKPLPHRAPLTGDRRPRTQPATEQGGSQGHRSLTKAVVDCAYYRAGERQGGTLDVDEAIMALDAEDEGFVWIGLHDPAPQVVEDLGTRFAIPPLAIEDAIHAHQRPKLEIGDHTLSIIFKTARYIDADELVEIGELMLFIGPRFVITVRHGGASPLTGLREDLQAHPDLLHLGPSAVLYAVADRIVDDYAVVLDGLDVDIEQIEAQVFSGATDNPAERIYRLKREVLTFKNAITPLVGPLEQLSQGTIPMLDPGSAEYLSDVRDHLVRDAEQVAGYSELLTSVLHANIAQVSVRDNEDMRKMSAWLAIIAVPTMVFGLYGMNFDSMPELRWAAGYPAVLGLTLTICGGLYGRFKRTGWL